MGHVVVTMANEGTELPVAVEDDGVGLLEGFDIEQTTRPGVCSIVRDLVRQCQLKATIAKASHRPRPRGWDPAKW